MFLDVAVILLFLCLGATLNFCQAMFAKTKLPQQSTLTVIFSNPVRNPFGILLESCCNLEFLLESGWNRDLIMWETFWKPAG